MRMTKVYLVQNAQDKSIRVLASSPESATRIAVHKRHVRGSAKGVTECAPSAQEAGWCREQKSGVSHGHFIDSMEE